MQYIQTSRLTEILFKNTSVTEQAPACSGVDHDYTSAGYQHSISRSMFQRDSKVVRSFRNPARPQGTIIILECQHHGDYLDMLEIPVLHRDQDIAVRAGDRLEIVYLITHIALDDLTSISSRASSDIVRRRSLVSFLLVLPEFFSEVAYLSFWCCVVLARRTAVATPLVLEDALGSILLKEKAFRLPMTRLVAVVSCTCELFVLDRSLFTDKVHRFVLRDHTGQQTLMSLNHLKA